jgi:hypothetical protein
VRRIVRSGSQEWLIASGPDAAAGEGPDLRDRAHARTLFARLLRDPGNARTLRTVLADAAPGIADSRVSEAELADHLASHAAAGRLRLIAPSRASNEFRTQNDQPPDDPEPQPLPPAPPPPRTMRRTTWVKFKVVDDATGEPVPGVRLRITTPDGIENFYTTNSAGMIELDGIDRGACDVACDNTDLKPEGVLDYVGMGDAGGSAGPATGNGRAATSKVVQVEFYKVKTGDSLDKLAKDLGITWKDLARFNWGTDDPAKINTHLRDDVGCTRTTASGKNYIFDSGDDPGLIRLPHPWLREGLATTETHTIRVQPLPSPVPWHFSV